MSKDDPFIRYLYSLKHESTGILAALRRACGQRFGESKNCQFFASISTRPADFLTATLVAQYSADQIKSGRHHTTYNDLGSIGAAWARYCRKRDREQDPAIFYKKRQGDLSNGRVPPRPPHVHERFRTLLDAEIERDGRGELAYRLRGLVRMLVAEDIPIDIIQLARDLRGWRAESHCVQERWAKAFYSPPHTSGHQSKKSEDPYNSDEESEESIEQEGEIHVD